MPEEKKELKIMFLITRKLSQLFLITGVLGVLQYFIIGIIGVIRGYSVQSYVPLCIAFISMCIILMICSFRKNNLSR